MTIDNFKSQHRGGKGIKGMQTIEDDFIADLADDNNPSLPECSLPILDGFTG